MRVEIVRIGNSRGVRLPKVLLEQYGFKEAAELSVENGRLVLSPVARSRAGWHEQFAQASSAELEADLAEILPDAVSAEWDAAEWQW
ncbi:AbrB/MazE/SpoVT family DNA-binding domain-containing protein [Gloeobacter kilaueensis]|uniref:Transcriptional regulator/antitoxin, MazE n=1 Tax=Gloeobacter kilaueensis (strain ATCC BAA-2537 / CCAP 1431/1 / ULC 316 / JS1) TaxID=1183438 RepID=U5QIR8_GLOK1|nr:transcriptional regulator/antitoxin, MazE [Gloeobacter kilaueensis JS1]